MLAGLGPFIEGSSSAPAPYTAEAVTFDGSNDYLNVFNFASVDSTYSCMLFSGWIYPSDLSNFQGIVTFGEGSASQIDSIIQIMNSGQIRLYQGGANGVNVVSTNTLNKNTWNHVMFSAEWGNEVQIYIDDVQDSITSIGPGQFKIDAPGEDSSVGSRVAGANPFNGDLAEIWYNYSNTFFDLTVTSNRRKFIDANGKPVDLGIDGSTPTGSQPLIYFSGPATEWNNGNNKGSITGYVMSGSVTDSANEPVEL